MHPDSKLASHGKTGGGGGGGQLQLHNVSQSPACGLSAKGLGAGAHGGGGSKASQPAPGGSGLKNSQAPVPTFGALKGKVKREQSVSGDSGERREAGAAAAAAAATSLDKELKGEVAPRSKRRCVLERKQPYSGDEWCSGPDSEEDDKPLGSTHNCNAAESAMTAASQLGPGPNPLPALSESNASSTPHGTAPGLRPDAGSGGGKQPLQFVYVFTTHLANTAAEAVLQGRADSILGYHQQHVPRAKLDQAPVPKLQAAPEPLPVAPSPASTPQSQAAVPPSSQAQGQPPPPALPSQPPAAPPLSLGQGPPPPPPPVNALPQEGAPEDPRRDLTPNSVGNGSSSTAPSGTHPSTPTAPSSLSASTAEGLLGEAAGSGPPSAGNGPRNPLNTEGLSKEQLEHRERSLQTLRDIERLLLRSSEAEPFLKAGEGGALPPAQAPPPPQAAQAPPPPGAGLKKYEEPLQSMISQTQSLGGPGLEQEGPVPPGLDVGQQMNLMMQRLGQDSLTPEQVAWRKLQEEYYEEKRRKEEQVGMHGARPLPDMMLPQPLGGMMLRGPPPPYHSKPGEQWLLRGVPMEPLQEPLQLRPAFSGPRFPGNQLPRGFAGMQNLPLETLGPMSSMQRPGRPGMAWSEDMPLGGPGNFAPGNLPYPPGPGEAERFLTPRAREEILRQQQQLLEKRQAGLQRPLGVEMERVMQAHRQMEPAMFAGEGLGMEFAGSRAMMSPPLREMEPALGPGNLNMNMNVNMNMNMNLNVQMTPQQQQQLLMSQKMRGPELLPAEEMARARAPNGTGAMMSGGPPKMMMGSPFSNQGQQSFPAVQGPYPAVPQEMGSAPDMFGSEQGGLGSTTRLSHIPLPPTTNAPPTSLHQAPARGLGRRPSDLALNMGQMNSPSVGCLKSPTLSQVHSPLGTSPSANLKSPQTPSSALVSLPAPSAPLKSPQVLSSVLSVRSPTSSPGHLKSPSMAVSSPGWVPSPKNALSSPGIGQNKPALGMSNSAPLGSLEQDPPPSQNPLSLMMSQMSKYAMPSSTPLYHNAIKTIATSDDELLPDRPLLPSGAMPGMGGAQPSQMAMNSLGPAPAQSPMGMALPGQQPLSHEPPAPTLSSPGPLGASMPMHSGAPPQNPMLLPPGPQDSLGQPCGPPGQLVFPPRLQQPPANGGGGGMPMAPGGGASGPGGPPHYPPGLGLPPEELPPSQPGQQQQQQQQAPPPPPQQQQQQQRLAGRLPESYPSVASVLSDPELSDVIRPTPTGIPEFDLSRIIPSEKPSSTLQYFPKGEGQQLPKAQPPSNLHLMNLQNMMAEQAPARPGPQGMQRAMAMCHPGQVPVLGRTGLAPQQAMMGNSLHQGMMLPPPPQQQSLLAQQNFLLMQAKQRSLSVSGEGYAQPAHLLASQGSLMGPPGPQQSLMGPHALRQRSVSLDSQMSYGPGPSSMANLPF
ncbi:B-cell CLL/lymphoma 9-like protein [Hemicordylus capensis]|uniref:B-cell CLL/lymphoma 9-like protein n=1 Tax=Hemicordylus capensis TaxID=884348 RepID=UPI0023031359|nr:B-cell CLL/lymphoma 9-like protein [Hemicordylus capensis]XP_053125676.1 B-cell CLL/lymphoma 9-like protein [Hemicordylus capensis]XP_053125677.1 B-cell CLL/lymphoma 9-like protein [Hemicordylus capensis]